MARRSRLHDDSYEFYGDDAERREAPTSGGRFSDKFSDAEWEDMGRLADQLDAYRATELARLRGDYRPPSAPMLGSKFCPQCKGKKALSDECDCPVCDGTGFKELITLEDVA